jgi:hypothetical protein
MANKPDDFLGGGVQFNKVGRAAPEQPTNEDTGPITVPTKISPRTVGSLVIVIVVIMLAVVMLHMADNGAAHTVIHGRHQVDPGEHTVDPDKDSNN